jgi:hypothetical protein
MAVLFDSMNLGLARQFYMETRQLLKGVIVKLAHVLITNYI